MAYEVGRLEGVPPAIANEFRKLAQALNAAVDGVVYRTLYAEPARLFDGLTVKADGTTWNPGAGAGIYTYYGGAWNKLG